MLAAFPLVGSAGKLVKYRGIHPLPPHTGAFCYIDVLHVHALPPSDMRGYRVLANQEHVFVGDEAALGYAGPKASYFGPHPLLVPDVPPTETLFCYLRGPHFHARAPAAGEPFVLRNGVYWFMGTFPAAFERDRFNIWVNDVRPIAGYHPPAADLAAAPLGYHLPATVEAPPPRPPVPTVAPVTRNAAPAAAGKAGTAKPVSAPRKAPR